MKSRYPVVMRQSPNNIIVFVPDFNINTQGVDYDDAIKMARDAISLVGVDMEDDYEPVPTPSDICTVKNKYPDCAVALVDVDFAEYRLSLVEALKENDNA